MVKVQQTVEQAAVVVLGCPHTVSLAFQAEGYRSSRGVHNSHSIPRVVVHDQDSMDESGSQCEGGLMGKQRYLPDKQ